jgi:hypothetical protein
METGGLSANSDKEKSERVGKLDNGGKLNCGKYMMTWHICLGGMLGLIKDA